jgi:hypothetical protein
MNTHRRRNGLITSGHFCGPPSYFFIKKQEGGCSDICFIFFILGKAKPWLRLDLPSSRFAASKEGEPQSALT